MMVEAFAQIDMEEIEPVLSITMKLPGHDLRSFIKLRHVIGPDR